MLLCPWDFAGKSTGVYCHFLLQRIFLTQGLNPGLLHCRQMLYRLSHQRSPRSKRLLISWLQSPSAVILEPPKIKSATVSTVSPSTCHEVLGPDAMILVYLMLNFEPVSMLKNCNLNFFIDILAGFYDIGEGNGTPLQYSCLENPMDGGA